MKQIDSDKMDIDKKANVIIIMTIVCIVSIVVLGMFTHIMGREPGATEMAINIDIMMRNGVLAILLFLGIAFVFSRSEK